MSGTVLVTGGAGYIGSHACKALAAAGYTPVTYDNLCIGNRWAVRWGPLEIGDIRDSAQLASVMNRHRPVGVMHFAALTLVGESMSEPGLYYRVNVGGAQTVMDAALAAGIRAFVFSSTCAVYGTPPKLPITEATPKTPINPYGASKLMVERILEDYDVAHGFRSAALRYFNAAGADPETEIGEARAVESHLLPLAMDALLGRRPPLNVLGTDYPTPDGTAIRDYIHVSDLAGAHVRALERLLDGAPSFACNLGTGSGHSIREVLDTIARVAGREVPHKYAARRPGDATELVADTALSRQLFGEGLTPRSDLDTIVSTALAWHRSDLYARFWG
ncbi:MAG: UDP-glucose 4-epimerase GalE [Rhodobacteraceae bacterium]|nr:UDP-glucose 4-epimerase GalE [Paracoccaceae bacterium]